MNALREAEDDDRGIEALHRMSRPPASVAVTDMRREMGACAADADLRNCWRRVALLHGINPTSASSGAVDGGGAALGGATGAADGGRGGERRGDRGGDWRGGFGGGSGFTRPMTSTPRALQMPVSAS